MLSLRGKLILWFVTFSFALAAASTALMYFSIDREFAREDQDFLASRVHSLRLILNASPFSLENVEREVAWKNPTSTPDVSYTRVLDRSGEPVAESRGMREILPSAVFPTVSSKERVHGGVQSTSGEPYRALTARIEDPTGQRGPWIVQVALNRAAQAGFLETYRRKAALVLLLGLAVAVLVGRILVARGFRPIQDLVSASREIRMTTLDKRIATEGLSAEVLELANTLNQVLDRLQDSFSRLSRFSADIAHELRTPLNNLRGGTEVALGKARTPAEYRELLGSNLEEYGRLTKVIDSLLFLARAEDPKYQVRRETFELQPEIEDLFDFYEGLASEAGVVLSYEMSTGLRAHAEKTLLLRAVGNVISNGIRYTPRGGSIKAVIYQDGGYLKVDVTDTGIGIEAKHIPRLFERFYRADSSRSNDSGGTGLGLSIVKTIADLHHGSVKVESTPGVGTKVSVSFLNKPVLDRLSD